MQPELSDRPQSSSAASSPSDAYAALNLNMTEDMAASTEGDIPTRHRSLSPTKRSAALMEGSEEVVAAPQPDTAMPEAATNNTMSTQATITDDNDQLPPYSPAPDTATAVATPTIDEQVARILAFMAPLPVEGQKGFVVSHKWLARVLARSSDPPQEFEYDKTATEGEIGCVDNSSVVSPLAFSSPTIPFESSEHPYIPLRPGLTCGVEFEIVPEEAWEHIISWYSLAEGQVPIVRFAHNTAPPGGATNVQYETYPPVFTIRKVTQEANRLSSPPTPPTTSNTTQANTGNTTPDTPSAVKVVASRTERFQSFLARSKAAAAIPIKHKVKVWRQLDPAQVSIEVAGSSQPGIITPATSRSTSPTALPATASPQSLLISPSVFAKRDQGTDYEEVDANDETNNEKYNGNVNLDTLALGQDQVLILEEQIRGPAGGEYASDARQKAKKTALTKPKDTPDSGRASPALSAPVTRGRAKRDGRPRGTVGLTNLGNTCYMNSALQCISRVEELALYFLHSNFKKDINPNNPLGYGGRMAKAYADLLSGLYSPGATSAFRPSSFKSALAAAQPMFSGYGQQDSQEFLSFLVDALHEDLNRIQSKPYIENPDSDDNTVHDPEAIKALGQTYQNNHRLRNDSVAMDLFNGFYKNTMVCPDCDKVSVTFDPYSLLTLQLPIENTWRGQIYFIPYLGKPIAYNIDMDKNSTWKAVKEFIASKNEGLTRDRLLLAEAFSHKVYKIFSDTDTIAESNIQAADVLCMYELPQAPTNTGYAPKKRGYRSIYSPEPPLPGMDSALADRMAVPLMHMHGPETQRSPNLVFNPSFVLITREEAKDYDAILRKVLVAVAGMTSSPILEETGEERPLSSTEAPADGEETTQTDDDSAAAADSEARVSDHSNPSEDGYVNVDVSESKATPPRSVLDILNPSTFIPPALRNLFTLKYVDGGGDMFCTGNGSLGLINSMQDRIGPRDLRRGSLESIHSASSRRSHDSAITDPSRSSPSSDEDALDLPDLVIGGQDAGFNGDIVSEDELAQPIPTIPSKRERRRNHDKKRGGRNNRNTYSKKGRRNSKQSSRPDTSRASTAQPAFESDEYYIRLGEGIVLDWSDSGFEDLFRGGEMRGTYTFEPKQVPVAEDLALREKLSRRKKRAQDGITLDDCFAETGKTEVLSEENAWYCNRCKELRRASKTLEIWTAPDILVVHLKRFSGERYRRDKVDVLVDFPMDGLDLTHRVGCKEEGKEYIYDLFAVDNHYGGLGGGHYTAYAKNFCDGKWYDFNDSMVSQQKGSVVSTAAYLLFYRRRSSQPLGPPALQELVNKVRNPDTTESTDASDAEYDSSGEGERLGGRSLASFRRPGSSNAGTAAAGAAATETQLQARLGAGGLGNVANQAVIQRLTNDEDDEGYGSGNQAVTNQSAGWGFDNIDEGDNNLGTLLADVDDEDRPSYHSMEGADTPGETSSNQPNAGSDYANSSKGHFDDDMMDGDGHVPGNHYNDDHDGGMFDDVGDDYMHDEEAPLIEHMPVVAVPSADDDATIDDEPPVRDITLGEE